jgi:DNA mismatch repair protein MSH2
VKTYNVIISLQGLLDYFENIPFKPDHPIEQNYTSVIKGILGDFENLKTLIEESVDINEVSRGDYIINPDYSETLRELYDNIQAKHKEMEAYRDELAKKHDIVKPINLIECNTNGFLLEVNRKEGDSMIRKNSSLVTVSSKKGYLSFTSKTLRGLVDEFREIQNDYKDEQATLVEKVLDLVATYFPVIERASHVVSELDVLLSFASTATNSSKAY